MQITKLIDCNWKARLFFCFMLQSLGCSPALDREFDASAWNAGDEEVRGSMLCDLLNISVGDWRKSDNLLKDGSRLKGLTLDEVKELLGDPYYEHESGGSISGHEYTKMIDYNIGKLNERGSFDEDFALMIGFNENDIVCLIHVSD